LVLAKSDGDGKFSILVGNPDIKDQYYIADGVWNYTNDVENPPQPPSPTPTMYDAADIGNGLSSWAMYMGELGTGYGVVLVVCTNNTV
jgi:hypothetical protein